MTHYIDIELLPSKELRENVLLNQIYSSFHKRLYDLKSNDIALSFPNYKSNLGRLFRIHGKIEVLEKLNEEDWPGNYKKFCKVSPIDIVPLDVKYRIVSRIQQNMTESSHKQN